MFARPYHFGPPHAPRSEGLTIAGPGLGYDNPHDHPGETSSAPSPGLRLL